MDGHFLDVASRPICLVARSMTRPRVSEKTALPTTEKKPMSHSRPTHLLAKSEVLNRLFTLWQHILARFVLVKTPLLEHLEHFRIGHGTALPQDL